MTIRETTNRAVNDVVAEEDDRALVRAVLGGDAAAARRLVERFEAPVFALCVRLLGHRQDAEDVAQETFVRALRGLKGFDGDRPLRPWLLGIAANRCRTALGRRSRHPASVESVDDRPDHRPGLADPDDLAAELDRAVGSLRHEYRTVFLLFHEQGLPYEEIAQAVDRPIGTVKTWLHRARAELADSLARRGIRP